VQDPETGGMLWPYDLTERATQRAGDVRGFPDLYSNASKEGGLLSNILGYFQGNKEPVTVRGYHGTRSEFDKFNGPSVYASENPDAASEWAMVANRDGEAPNVLPLDITASNPYYAKSLFPDQAELDRIAAADPDVVFYPPSTQYGTTFDKYPGQVFEARKPGTVRSATTGETLFSNADSKPALLASGLDMGQEARLARARDMGFDTDTTWYHGTMADFPEFSIEPTPGRDIFGVHLGTKDQANDITKATGYAKRNISEYWLDSRVLPLHVKEGNLLELPDLGKDNTWDIGSLRYEMATRGIDFLGDTFNPTLADVRKSLQAAGYDGIKYLNEFEGVQSGPQNSIMLFDPRNIRSVNAAFDPAKSDSANLLAANADSRPALLGAGQEQDIPDWLLPYLR
jgi:hypothetical protein